MKTIGFIDYFIDEGHANLYPRLIRESALKDKFEVALAWEEIPKEGGKNIDQWCREQKVQKAASIAEVVGNCDCLAVLSPDNAERHEALADLPLQSGKPVYIDKPLAPSLAAARRIFAKARRHHTPLMSSSALRFGSALEQALKDRIAGNAVHFVSTGGGGMFPVYGIHQLEMLVMTLGLGARRVMQCGNKSAQVMVIDYPDGRRGLIRLHRGQPFQLNAQFGENDKVMLDGMDDYFPRLVEGMLNFFDTGKSPVPEEQTFEIIALLETGIKALNTPDVWVEVARGT